MGLGFLKLYGMGNAAGSHAKFSTVLWAYTFYKQLTEDKKSCS